MLKADTTWTINLKNKDSVKSGHFSIAIITLNKQDSNDKQQIESGDFFIN